MQKFVFLFLSIFFAVGCVQKKESKWVFILAGQSNMAGRGIVESQDTISDPGIFTLNKEMELAMAKEPLHFYEPKLAGLDCGLSFAKKLRAQVPDAVEIVLVPCAVGGSSVQQWLGDSLHRNVKLYSNFKKRVAYAKQIGTIKGVIWHQGESDAHPNGLRFYQSRLKKLFQKFRKDIGNDKLPILAGELGRYAELKTKNNNWAALNDILYHMAKADSSLYIVSSKGLKSKSDKVHFNAEAQRELGKRFANRFLTIETYKK